MKTKPISFREDSPFSGRQGSGASIVDKVVVVPHGPAATSETIAKEIHQRMIGRQQQQVRDELFGSPEHDTSGRHFLDVASVMASQLKCLT